MGTKKLPLKSGGPAWKVTSLQNSPDSQTQWGFLPRPRAAPLKVGSPGQGVGMQSLRLLLRLAESETLGTGE